MPPETPPIPLLQRREIEAKIVGPLIRGFVEAMGRDAAVEVVRQVITGLARDGGADLAARLGDASLTTFAQALDLWREGGALEIDLLEQAPERLSFNVTRCRYAELYLALGLADLGGTLSCQRDFALIQGFNPAIRLERTQTIMEGASHCDFRFRSDADPRSA
jgi:L-2-amino-thiazoline-4-carboxylic acid hydrolase